MIPSVSTQVFTRGHRHRVQVVHGAAGRWVSRARVTSATSGTCYNVELWVDPDRTYPTFPYLWTCNCYWGRERFSPCSHVIAVALARGRKYETEYETTDAA